MTADPVLVRLMRELREYPAPDDGHAEPDPMSVVVPFRMTSEAGELAFFSTVTVFGTPVDITLSELALEAFYPADVADGGCAATDGWGVRVLGCTPSPTPPLRGRGRNCD